MLKIITSRAYNELIQQLNGLRSVNDSKDARIVELESEIAIQRGNNEDLKNLQLQKVSDLKNEIHDLKKLESEFRKKIIDLMSSFVDKDKEIEDLKDEIKVRNGMIKDFQTEVMELKDKINAKNETILNYKDEVFKHKGSIEKLEIEVSNQKNKVAEQVKLRELVVKEQLPNTLKEVELPKDDFIKSTVTKTAQPEPSFPQVEKVISENSKGEKTVTEINYNKRPKNRGRNNKR